MKRPLFICGPCAIESESIAFAAAETIAEVKQSLEIDIVYKSSFDKANRTSHGSGRGVGLAQGMDILSRIRDSFGLKITSDVHTEVQAREVGSVVDIVQIPALLCRQTDIVESACSTPAIVNIKKGQFLSPSETLAVYEKAKSFKPNGLLITERGTLFGYSNLINDFKSVFQLQQMALPLVFDATHSVQSPGSNGASTGGNREYVEALARCAAVCGVRNFFFETHPDPDAAVSDGPNMVPLWSLKNILTSLLDFIRVQEERPFADLHPTSPLNAVSE